MGNVLLWITLAHEYIDMFVNIDTHRTWGRLKRAGDVVILKKNLVSMSI